jgi:hypothetical protein
MSVRFPKRLVKIAVTPPASTLRGERRRRRGCHETFVQHLHSLGDAKTPPTATADQRFEFVASVETVVAVALRTAGQVSRGSRARHQSVRGL